MMSFLGVQTRMKKFLIIVVIAIASAFAINFIVGPILASYLLNQNADKNLQVGDFTVKYNRIKVGRLASPNLTVQNLTVHDPYGFIQIRVPSLVFDTEWQWDSQKSMPRFVINLQVAGLKVVAYQPKADAPTQQNQPQAKDSQAPSWEKWLGSGFFDVAAGLVVQSASVIYKDSADKELYSLDPFDLSLSIDDLSQPDKLIEILLKGNVKANVSPTLPFNLPIELEAKPLQFGGNVVSASGMRLKLGGFEFSLQGLTDLGKGSHNWKLSMSVKSLLDLPIPPDMLPPGKWFGGLQGEAQVYQEPGQPMTLISSFKTLNFGGDVAMKTEAYSVAGRLLSEISWNVRYQNEVLAAKDIKVSVNADALQVEAPPYFRKTKGDKFAIDVEGYVADDILVVKSKRIQLNQLNLDFSSSVGLKDKMLAAIRVNLKRTPLKGLEKLFPPLSKQPMQGQLQFRSEVMGPLSGGAEALKISANPILLENFKTNLSLKDEKNKIYATGPVTANLKGAVRLVKNQVDIGKVNGEVDLSSMDLNYKGQFNKKKGQKLAAKIDLGHQRQSLVTKGTVLSYGPSSLTVKGSLKNFSNPVFDLNLKLSNFQTSLLQNSSFWPTNLVASGAVAGDFDVAGSFDQIAGIAKSPIKIKGVANANFSNFEYITEPAKVSAEAQPVEEAKALKTVPAFLPAWPLLKDLNLTLNTKVAKFRQNKITGQGLAAKAVIAKGGASMSATIAKIFNGQISMKKLLVPLIWENPVIRMSGSVKAIDVPMMFKSLELEEGLPKMTGLATGTVNLSTEMPQSERFLASLQSAGQLDLQKFELKEINLTEGMMQTLSKVPQLGVKKDNAIKGFKGVAKIIYDLKKQVMKLSQLDLLSYNKDQFLLKGTLKLAGPVDLKGNLILSKPPFGGEVYECNKDKQGRISFPVVVKANWMSPDFTVPKQSLDALFNKTLNCQKKKLEQQAKKEADKKIKEVKKNLEGETLKTP
jgi:hypothetical protein